MFFRKSLNKIIPRQPLAVVSVIGILIEVPILGLMAARGWFVRYVADDFCTASSVFNLGWWDAQWHWYTHWSGRFGFTALVTGLELLGDWVSWWLPLITLLIWVVGLAWLCRLVLRQAKFLVIGWPALFMAVTIICVYVLTNPHPGQAFYWFTGSLTYTLPLIMMTYAAALLVRSFDILRGSDMTLGQFWRQRTAWLAVGAGLLLFIAASLNETHAFLQLVVLGLVGLLVVVAAMPWRVKLPYLSIVALVTGCSLVSTLLMFVAPGNSVRSANYPPHPTIERTLEFSFNATNSYLLIDWQYAWFVYLLVISIVLFWLGRINVRPNRKLIPLDMLCRGLAAAVSGYVLCVCLQVPSFYVQSYPTYERSLAATPVILSVAVVVLGFYVAELLRTHLPQRWEGHATKVGLALFGLVVAQIGYSQTVFTWGEFGRELPQLRAYAAAWDKQNAVLQLAGGTEKEVVVSRLGHTFGLEDVTSDPSHWVNGCMAAYYDIDSIVAE